MSTVAARIDRGDLAKIAQNLGRSGRPAPDWVREDPQLVAAYDQGTGDGNRGAQFHPPAPLPGERRDTTQDEPASSSSGAAAKPKVKRAKRRYTDRAFSPSAAVNRTPLGAVSSAGDSGGLLLAFVLYPIALAVLKHGAAGPGLWFRAKWLNETAKEPNNLGPVPLHNATSPKDNVPGKPGYHRREGTPS